jgi:hypothetical protein
MNIYPRTGPRVLHSTLSPIYSACPLCSYYLGMLCESRICIALPLTVDLVFIFRQQCKVLSPYTKPRLHLVESDAASVPCTTMSSPNHIMSSFSQAGSSTTHTTANSPKIFRSFCTSINLHTYLCCVTGSQARQSNSCRVKPVTSSMPRHGRVTPRPYMSRQTSSVPHHMLHMPRQTPP